MNQPPHAWLAVEAFRTIQRCSTTDAGKQHQLDKLAALLGQHLNDVVVAAWLPDALIKDMTYGHVFKTSKYDGSDGTRFIVSRADLKKGLALVRENKVCSECHMTVPIGTPAISAISLYDIASISRNTISSR